MFPAQFYLLCIRMVSECDTVMFQAQAGVVSEFDVMFQAQSGMVSECDIMFQAQSEVVSEFEIMFQA